jgi:hypothetical protein
MEAIMEPVAIPGRINGTSIIDDLCDRIAEKLAKNCDLRAVDSYSGYAAKVRIELQLLDIDPVEVSVEVAAGKINSLLPSARIDLDSEVLAEATESASLERPIDPDGATEAAVKERRHYTPRGAAPLSFRPHK